MPNKNARKPSVTSHDSYSAVILADLVADVPILDPEHGNSRRSSAQKEKKEINHGFEDNGDENSSPAVVPLDPMETVHLGSMKNGAGISKGVILNAVQFVNPETKVKFELEKTEKPALSNTSTVQVSQVPETSQEAKVSSGYSDMSLSRKVAFGASFLPSIFFVLCFAIILPCQKPVPCIEERFKLIMNDTDVPTLKIPENIVFTYKRKDENGIMSLSEYGKELWNTNLKENAKFLECGNITTHLRKDCLVMTNSGVLQFFNTRDGSLIWNRVLVEELEETSFPLILPDCNGDDIAEIAMSLSKEKIKVLSHGNIVYSIDISGCDTTPTRLTSWTKNGTTDLLFVCQKGEKDVLFTLKQSIWCYTDKEIFKTGTILLTSNLGALQNAKILPRDDKLVLWVEDELITFNANNEEEWRISIQEHSGKNRFLLFGKFQAEGKQIALFSGDLSSKFLATAVDVKNGNTTWTKSIKNAEASDVVYVRGKEKDFALINIIKINRQKDIASEAVARINGMTTTIVSLITNESIRIKTNIPQSETLQKEIFVMDLEGKDGVVIDKEEISKSDGPFPKSTLFVDINEDNENRPLTIYILNKPNQTKGALSIRSIKVANWDTSTKESMCASK